MVSGPMQAARVCRWNAASALLCCSSLEFRFKPASLDDFFTLKTSDLLSLHTQLTKLASCVYFTGLFPK